jgi:hypothetical protein
MGKKNMRPTTPDPQPSVHVHIDELVLHGFAPADRYRIAAAVQVELTRLFAEQGVSSALRQGGEASRLKAQAISVTPTMTAGAIGTQVARSVYGSLSPNDHDRTRNR